MKERAGIDELFLRINRYRTSEEFENILKFLHKFRYLSPYNAMLVGLQRPGARLVLSPYEWKKRYGRKIKPNAQNLITLWPFGPIDVKFDIDDTEPEDPGISSPTDKIIDDYLHAYDTKGSWDDKMWENLLSNLAQFGIAYDLKMHATTSYAAYISAGKGQTITIKLSKENSMEIKCSYFISVNKNQADPRTIFASVCHELGHLFCNHLGYYGKDKRPNLTQSIEEFEAETVSWIVCQRVGIKNPSEKYLAGYLKQDQEIPKASIDKIITAVAAVESMLGGLVSIKRSPFYKQNKREIDQQLATLKNQKKKSSNIGASSISLFSI